MTRSSGKRHRGDLPDALNGSGDQRILPNGRWVRTSLLTRSRELLSSDGLIALPNWELTAGGGDNRICRGSLCGPLST